MTKEYGKVEIARRFINSRDFIKANAVWQDLQNDIRDGKANRVDLEPEYGIVSSTLLIECKEYETAVEEISNSLSFEPNNYELCYCMALCLEQEICLEDSYVYYVLALQLCKNIEDREIIHQSFHRFCENAGTKFYINLSHACQRMVVQRLRIGEYVNTLQFLHEQFYKSDISTIVRTESNMLLYIMLQIVNNEKNHMRYDQFLMDNTCVRYSNDLSLFKEAFVKIKMGVRRIWFGLSVLEQKELNYNLSIYPVSFDMLAQIIQYCVESSYWGDVFEQIYHVIKKEHSQIGAGIYLYWQQALLSEEYVKHKAMPPDSYDNRPVITKIYFNRRSRTVNSIGLKANKICFIMCTNNEVYSEECVHYLRHLRISKQMEVEVIQVWNATGMAAGYNMAMHMSDAKYKFYIHQDSFLVNHNIILDTLSQFEKNSELGMLGIAGHLNMNDSGVWWNGEKSGIRAMLYQDNVLNIVCMDSGRKTGSVEYADALDGVLMATCTDSNWREDLFDGWHFYDVSQCYEIRKLGFQIGVMNADKMWIMHDTEVKQQVNVMYNHYCDIFKQNYLGISNK